MLSRRNFSAITAIGALFISAPAFPISRVGNASVADSLLGFSATAPGTFPFSQNLSKEGLRLVSMPTLNVIAGSPAIDSSQIDIYPFNERYPELTNIDNTAVLRTHFSNLSSNWKVRSVGCIQILENANHDENTVIAWWGKSKGIVLTGSNSLSLAGIDRIVDSIHLTSGECVWN